MTEKELQEIEAPNKDEISPRRKKVNTTVFTVVMSVLNLVYTIAIVLLLIVGCLWLVNKFDLGFATADVEKWSKIILWVSVILGIVIGFFVQKLLSRGIIKLFKLENKLEKDYVSRVFGKKPKDF